jgi:hypothetical protein
MADTHPSKAYIDNHGNYVHDPLNQHYAEEAAKGKLAPQDGYCDAHKRLGCEACA